MDNGVEVAVGHWSEDVGMRVDVLILLERMNELRR